MRSLAEQTYRQIFLGRQKWDQGFGFSKNGRLKKGRGFWAAIMRFVRRIRRALFSSPENFEAAVKRQLNQLADDLSHACEEEIETWRFEIARRKPQKDMNVGEVDFFLTLDKTIRIVQNLPDRTRGRDILEAGLVEMQRRNLF
jgi:hypothetical protein